MNGASGPVPCSLICIVPIVTASWPVLTAAVAAAAQALGYRLLHDRTEGKEGPPPAPVRVVKLALENSQILEEALARGRSLVLEKDDVRLTLRRGVRGQVTVFAESDSLSQADLQARGQELLDRISQQYAYNKLLTELKNRRYITADEQVAEDGRICLTLRFVA